jgi:hypothetical protein
MRILFSALLLFLIPNLSLALNSTCKDVINQELAELKWGTFDSPKVTKNSELSIGEPYRQYLRDSALLEKKRFFELCESHQQPERACLGYKDPVPKTSIRALRDKVNKDVEGLLSIGGGHVYEAGYDMFGQQHIAYPVVEVDDVHEQPEKVIIFQKSSRHSTPRYQIFLDKAGRAIATQIIGENGSEGSVNTLLETPNGCNASASGFSVTRSYCANLADAKSIVAGDPKAFQELLIRESIKLKPSVENFVKSVEWCDKYRKYLPTSKATDGAGSPAESVR